jgi:hypothetical protein
MEPSDDCNDNEDRHHYWLDKGLKDFMGKYSIAVLTMSVVLAVSSLPLQAQTNNTGPSEIAAPKPKPDVYFINRAKNLARQAATKANGGLERYRPDPVMYGPAVQTSYVNNSNGSITFTFKGSTPGGATPSIETVATVMPDGSVNIDYNGAIRGGAAAGSLPPSNPTPSVAPNSTTAPAPAKAAPIPAVSPSSAPVNTPPKQNGLPILNSPAPSSSVPPSSPGATPSATTPRNGASTPMSIADEDAFLSKARNIARQSVIKANGGLDKYRPDASMFGPASKSPHVKNADGSLTFTFKGGSPGSTTMTIESVVTVSSTGSASIQYNGPVR